MRIHPVSLPQNTPGVSTPKTQKPEEDFAHMLMDALREVNSAQLHAAQVQNDLMAGRPVEYHDLVFAMERASIAMELTLQVRNKLLEAYQEIQRLQI
ncbi:MAG: flagellar hook-basal body complex protein FliE [Fimbriimonadales bacterium]|nr:flagellar hook-basal body complex protein FliE [Fimbriimonadales bacterium]